jgi:hypothetical protein
MPIMGRKKQMWRTAALWAIFGLAACSESKDGASNSVPEAAITSHSDGEVILDGEFYVMGAVTDGDDGPSDLRTTWLINGVAACPLETPMDDGRSRCLVRFEQGSAQLQLLVLDPVDATGEAEVNLEVEAPTPPQVRIDSPASGYRAYTDLQLALMGWVSDPKDPAEGLQVEWRSDLDGLLDVDSNVTDSGEVSALATLSIGSHALSLHAENTAGRRGSDTVIFEVGPPNTPPSCAITNPEEGARIPQDADTLFGGSTLDTDQPADELIATWTSDLDGELDSAHPTTAGDINVMLNGLSLGIHTITLSVMDELTAPCSDTILVQVEASHTTSSGG